MVGLLSACGGGGGFPSLNGAGATFPAAAYQRWANDFSARSGGRVMYQSVGSGAGVCQFLAGTVDFGATDEALSEEEFKAAARRGVVQIPMLGGTVTPAYNQPACKALRLTQAQLIEIFEGTLKDWQQLGCGSGPITVVHRSDGSGTTFAFTNSLSCFSERWKSQVGKGKSVSWPVGVGAKGNEGGAAAIANSPGAIGYVNQAYVRGPIQAAALQNRHGQFVLADAASGAAGLNAVQLDGRLGGSQCNPSGAHSFPIVAFTWMLAYGHGNGAAKAKPCAVSSTGAWLKRLRPRRPSSAMCPCRAGCSPRPGRPSPGSSIDRYVGALPPPYPALNRITTGTLPQGLVIWHTLPGIRSSSCHGANSSPRCRWPEIPFPA